MREATVLTKMDLRSGFHQILVFPEHKERTTFQARWGTFQYCVMPFGLCNAPATFQRTMNALLQEFHAYHIFLDASEFALGATLNRLDEHGYPFSTSASPKAKLLTALRKWRHYVHGARIIAHTDNVARGSSLSPLK